MVLHARDGRGIFASRWTGIIDVSGVRLSDSPQQERGARSGVSTIAREKLMAAALISAAAIGLALAGSGYWTLWQSRNTAADNVLAPALVTFPERRPLAEFILVDDEKGVFDLGSLTSRWSFIFFGFMYCPFLAPALVHHTTKTLKQFNFTYPIAIMCICELCDSSQIKRVELSSHTKSTLSHPLPSPPSPPHPRRTDRWIASVDY